MQPNKDTILGIRLVCKWLRFAIPRFYKLNGVKEMALIGGDNFNNFIDGIDGDDTIFGYGGNDTIYGGNSGNDVIYAGTGDDFLDGGEGNDLLSGDEGNDTLNGTRGDDELYGGDGIDILYGGFSNDLLSGGAGGDVMYGGEGEDSYYVNNNADLVEEDPLDPSEDTVFSSISYTLPEAVENLLLLSAGGAINGTGNFLDNEITGNRFKNILRGSDGSDTLFGDDGHDKLIGGEGDDLLQGGVGNDTLTGGLDNDSFDFTNSPSFSPLGVDTINNFNSGIDSIVLSRGIFSLNGSPGGGFDVGEFAVVATNAAARLSAATIVYNRTNGSLFYNENADADGFGLGGKFINFAGAPTLAATDFSIV
jgi:Ca2+-binding RTX toxin-like protein